MQEQKYPDLAQMTSTLAANLSRVGQYTEQLALRIDDLVTAATHDDWNKVSQLSEELAQKSRTQGYRGISALAERVCTESKQPNNEQRTKSSLVRLISTCGHARTRPSRRAARHLKADASR